jgi:outer membrane biosynthesis protein TonB
MHACACACVSVCVLRACVPACLQLPTPTAKGCTPAAHLLEPPTCCAKEEGEQEEGEEEQEEEAAGGRGMVSGRDGDRPSEAAILAAIEQRAADRAASKQQQQQAGPGAADDPPGRGPVEGKPRRKKEKRDRDKHHKKKSKSKKHKKEKKHKKKHKKEKKRERSSGSSDSSDSDESTARPVQLSEFMRGSARTAGGGAASDDDGDARYSSITGLRIMNNRESTDADREAEAKRARKLAKLNGGGQDEFQAWGDNMKRRKITDPNALALMQTLKGISRVGKTGPMDAESAKSLDSKRKKQTRSR